MTWEDSYYPNEDHRFERSHQRSPFVDAWKDEFFSDFSKHRRSHHANYQVIEIR